MVGPAHWPEAASNAARHDRYVMVFVHFLRIILNLPAQDRANEEFQDIFHYPSPRVA
jgi:hypothetical protein